MKRIVGHLAVCTAALLLLLLLPFSAMAAPQGREHYLLIGVDGWGLSEEGGARSDAIILATLDYDEDRVTLVSFARDALVQPSYRKGLVKLNALVRSTGGDNALVQYIEEAFSIPVSGYFLVNFSGAVDVINAIGGVEIELTRQEANYIRQDVGRYKDYPLEEGLCRLNGGQALSYMRCRDLDNDFGRQHRQGNVLRAAFRSLTQLSMLDALRMLDDVLGMYRTDMRMFDQVALVKNALSLRHARLETHSLPAEGTYQYGVDGTGASALAFDLPANQALLWQWLGMEPPEGWTEEEKQE